MGAKTLDDSKEREVKTAYVMETAKDAHGNVILGNLYDIGIISLSDPLDKTCSKKLKAWRIEYPIM